jgi:hypothetical protein
MLQTIIFYGVIVIVFLLYLISGFTHGFKQSLKSFILNLFSAVVALILAVILRKYINTNFGIILSEDKINYLLEMTKFDISVILFFGQITFTAQYNALIFFMFYMLIYNITRQFNTTFKNTNNFENKLSYTNKLIGGFIGIINCALAYFVASTVFTQVILGIAI